MTVLFMPIGIPGCGKTHMARGLGVPVVSTDTIRFLLTGSESDQSRNGDVFKQFHAGVHAYLINGKSVFADATNLTASARKNLREQAESAARIQPVKIHVILFRNVTEAVARNAARDRVVPEGAMVRMIENYENTLIQLPQEDYDFITEVSATR